MLTLCWTAKAVSPPKSLEQVCCSQDGPPLEAHTSISPNASLPVTQLGWNCLPVACVRDIVPCSKYLVFILRCAAYCGSLLQHIANCIAVLKASDPWDFT